MQIESNKFSADFVDLGRTGSARWFGSFMSIILVSCSTVMGTFFVTFFNGMSSMLWRKSLAPLPNVALSAIIDVIGTWYALRFVFNRIERRPLLTLVSTDGTFKLYRVMFGAALWVSAFLAVAGIFLCLNTLYPVTGSNEEANFAFPGMESTLLLLIALVPVALGAAFEEMIFRGWFTQIIGRQIKNRLVLSVIVGLIFATLHGVCGWPIFAETLIFSIGQSAISFLDNRIELAIGAHVVNNIWATIYFFVNSPGKSKESLYANPNIGWRNVMSTAVMYILMFTVIYYWRRTRIAERTGDET